MLLLSFISGVVGLLSIIIDDVDSRLWLFPAYITGSLIICSIVTVTIVIGVLILIQIITNSSINISIVTKSIATTTTTSQINPLTIFISIKSL